MGVPRALKWVRRGLHVTCKRLSGGDWIPLWIGITIVGVAFVALGGFLPFPIVSEYHDIILDVDHEFFQRTASAVGGLVQQKFAEEIDSGKALYGRVSADEKTFPMSPNISDANWDRAFRSEFYGASSLNRERRFFYWDATSNHFTGQMLRGDPTVSISGLASESVVRLESLTPKNNSASNSTSRNTSAVSTVELLFPFEQLFDHFFSMGVSNSVLLPQIDPMGGMCYGYAAYVFTTSRPTRIRGALFMFIPVENTLPTSKFSSASKPSLFDEGSLSAALGDFGGLKGFTFIFDNQNALLWSSEEGVVTHLAYDYDVSTAVYFNPSANTSNVTEVGDSCSTATHSGSVFTRCRYGLDAVVKRNYPLQAAYALTPADPRSERHFVASYLFQAGDSHYFASIFSFPNVDGVDWVCQVVDVEPVYGAYLAHRNRLSWIIALICVVAAFALVVLTYTIVLPLRVTLIALAETLMMHKRHDALVPLGTPLAHDGAVTEVGPTTCIVQRMLLKIGLDIETTIIELQELRETHSQLHDLIVKIGSCLPPGAIAAIRSRVKTRVVPIATGRSSSRKELDRPPLVPSGELTALEDVEHETHVSINWDESDYEDEIDGIVAGHSALPEPHSAQPPISNVMQAWSHNHASQQSLNSGSGEPLSRVRRRMLSRSEDSSSSGGRSIDPYASVREIAASSHLNAMLQWLEWYCDSQHQAPTPANMHRTGVERFVSIDALPDEQRDPARDVDTVAQADRGILVSESRVLSRIRKRRGFFLAISIHLTEGSNRPDDDKGDAACGAAIPCTAATLRSGMWNEHVLQPMMRLIDVLQGDIEWVGQSMILASFGCYRESDEMSHPFRPSASLDVFPASQPEWQADKPSPSFAQLPPVDRCVLCAAAIHELTIPINVRLTAAVDSGWHESLPFRCVVNGTTLRRRVAACSAFVVVQRLVHLAEYLGEQTVITSEALRLVSPRLFNRPPVMVDHVQFTTASNCLKILRRGGVLVFAMPRGCVAGLALQPHILQADNDAEHSPEVWEHLCVAMTQIFRLMMTANYAAAERMSAALSDAFPSNRRARRVRLLCSVFHAFSKDSDVALPSYSRGEAPAFLTDVTVAR